MVVTPLNVSARLDWRKVSEYLGIGPQPVGMTGRCPVCLRPALITYQDTLHGGDWHYCTVCAEGWDTLELAADATRTGIKEAASGLVGAGLLRPEDATEYVLDRYVTWFTARRARTRQFWAVAASNLASGRCPARPLLDQLGGQVASRLLESLGAASPVGIMPAAELNEFLGSGRHKPMPDGTFEARVPWEPAVWRVEGAALLFPVSDLPGRISMFTGLVDTGADVRPFRALTISFSKYCAGERAQVVGGASNLETLFRPPGPLGYTLFLFTDPKVAARVQLSHLNRYGAPAPVLGAAADLPACGALDQQVPKRPVIVCADRCDADVIRHARAYGARIHLYETPPGDCSEAWFEGAVRAAKPWSELFCASVSDLSVPAVDAALRAQHFNGPQLNELFRAAPVTAQWMFGETGGRVAVAGRFAVLETEDGWRLRNGRLLCPAVIRIEQIVSCDQRAPPADGRLRKRSIHPNRWFVGAVVYKGRRHPFTWSAGINVAQLRDHANDILRGAGGPQLRPEAPTGPRNGPTLYATALAFHPPAVVHFGRPGWNEKTRAFDFGSFTLGPGEAITPVEYPAGVPAPKSATNLKPPSPVSAADLAALDGMGGVVWPVLGVVLHNLLAPAFGQQSVGCVLEGAPAGPVAVAKAAGCAEEVPAERPGRWVPVRWDEKLASGAWPRVFFQYGVMTKPWLNWLQPGRNLIVVAEARHRTRLTACPRWVEAPRNVKVPTRRVLDVVSRIVPDFLRYCLTSPTVPGPPGVCFIERVWVLITGYLDARGGTAPDRVMGGLRYDGLKAGG